MAHTGEEDVREWEILLSSEVESFLDDLYESDPASHQLVNQAILILSARTCRGPTASRLDHGLARRDMKEVDAAIIRAQRDPDLLVFDPWRAAILLVAGDKSGQWDKWYRTVHSPGRAVV